MNHDPSHRQQRQRLVALLLSLVIGVAVVGFFVGINDGVPIEDREPIVHTTLEDRAVRPRTAADDLSVIPSMHYWEMRRSQAEPTAAPQASLERSAQPEFDLFAEIQPSEEAKRQSLATRSERRAFNGAPPVVPHPIEQTSDAACYACHGKGVRIGRLAANRMSHEFLANCLQCHAPPAPTPFAEFAATPPNEFVGLKAPHQGDRAYPGAPPTIPHSTWMREQCLSCHGREAGWAGLEVTHPWRANCLQCHASSAELEQAVGIDPRSADVHGHGPHRRPEGT